MNFFDNIELEDRSKVLLGQILRENPWLEKEIAESGSPGELNAKIRQKLLDEVRNLPHVYRYYRNELNSWEDFCELGYRDYALVRLLDYTDHAGRQFEDLNLRGDLVESHPFKLIWLGAKHGTGGARPDFFSDMLFLFRQYHSKATYRVPSVRQVESWMSRFPSGLEPGIRAARMESRLRILKKIIMRIDAGEVRDPDFYFEEGMSTGEKLEQAMTWWDNRLFHLRFAAKSPADLFYYLDGRIDEGTMDILQQAKSKGIPFFVNPYYLSLLLTGDGDYNSHADQTIRDYIFYSRELVEEFGMIKAWEKEDEVEAGKPNAAGWILPSANYVHRRYPEVAIFIPQTMGRACGGLCASCQRMYDFQSGNFNFQLKKLKPDATWPARLDFLLEYFRNDSMLCDILITGGDALMSSDRSLVRILNAVYRMAIKKSDDNRYRKNGHKYAEMLRIRLGTRLPVYLPQRVTPALVDILRDFRLKASRIGFRQFIIQTHFQSPLEVTPEAAQAVRRLLSSGWIVTNQLVFTSSASRRGHTAKLRKVLNGIGVLTYYTFTVKGYHENKHNFCNNARSVQELMEEKIFGRPGKESQKGFMELTLNPESMQYGLGELMKNNKLPFLSTDRNVINLPANGKSMSFRTIGISRYGRRILSFNHDPHRNHSPVIENLKEMIIIESKTMEEYLSQLEGMGETRNDYSHVWGFSTCVTEPRFPVFEYPEYNYAVTKEITNLKAE